MNGAAPVAALRPVPFTILTLMVLQAPMARAQLDPHRHHHPPLAPSAAAGAGQQGSLGADHSSHGHDLGPAGSTYDLRWIDAMAQHHNGALRMSEFVFDSGAPGVGALAREIWNDQVLEIRAMALWRRAWYPEAPTYPLSYRPGGDPNALEGLRRMTPDQIDAMQMVGSAPTRENRITWFLEGMLLHHGGALRMAHDALGKSTNPTIIRLARSIIATQSREIIRLRNMLRHDGLNKPAYVQFDSLFSAY